MFAELGKCENILVVHLGLEVKLQGKLLVWEASKQSSKVVVRQVRIALKASSQVLMTEGLKIRKLNSTVLFTILFEQRLTENPAKKRMSL